MDPQTFVEKSWGYEVWFANTDQYCGKLLCVRKGQWSSGGKFHYHKVKDETFFVIEGTLILDVIQDSGNVMTYRLGPNTSLRIFPGQKHRFSTDDETCRFIEASTTHMEEDSIRCQSPDGDDPKDQSK